MSKISIWPTVWQCTRGKRHLDLLEAHRKYGSVVRVAPDMLSFNTGSSARVIYGPRHANLVKSVFHLTLDATVSIPSVFAIQLPDGPNLSQRDTYDEKCREIYLLGSLKCILHPSCIWY